MCNGLYWVCTHSGNMDDENMNVFVIFLQIIMSLVKGLKAPKMTQMQRNPTLGSMHKFNR